MTCQNWETRKLHFSLKCCISELQEFNLLNFFNLFDSQLILTLPYDSLNLVINSFSSGLLGGMVQDKLRRERCRSWTVLHAQCTSALSPGFSISQGNAEALDRWDGKTKRHLISYFLSNTSAKNYRNRIVYVKIIASLRGTFLRHSVECWQYHMVTSRSPSACAVFTVATKLMSDCSQLTCSTNAPQCDVLSLMNAF